MKPLRLSPLHLSPLLLVLTLAACGVRAQDDTQPLQLAQSSQAESSPAQTQPSTVTRGVRTVRAEMGSLSVTRSASATVEPAQESQVSAGTTGQVEVILARSGDRVEAGQTVIQLGSDALQLQRDNAQLALQTARINLASAERTSSSTTLQSEAALKAAQTGAEIARQQYAEGQALLAAGGISQTELAQLEVAAEQAEASLLQAQAAAEGSLRAPEEDLELLRLQVQQAQTQVAQAEQSLSDTRLTAPFAGEIAEILIDEGEFIGAGSPAFRLTGAGRQRARFNVAPEDAARLLEQGQIWLPYNGLDYAAQVTGSSQTEGGRLVEVVAEIYPSESRIPTGTVTQFNYELKLAEGILLPSSALRQRGRQLSVLVVREGRADEVPVTLLGEGGSQIAVSGLEPGVQVISPLPADLSPGTQVEVLGT